MTRPLVIGSRGSKLALWQAEQARERLRQLNSAVEIRIEIIKTTGDVKSDPLSVIGGKGVFTKEIEDALLNHEIAPRDKSLDAPVPPEEARYCSARFFRELQLIR